MKRGDTFQHRHWRDETDVTKPMQCVVTCVRGSLIYWRPLSGGKPMMFDMSEMDRYVSPTAMPRP